MDQSDFDDIARSLAAPSRRSLLAIAGAAALSALLGRDDAGLGKGKKKKKKKKKPKPCTENCVGKVCGDSNGCGGSCTACPQGKTCINTQCIDDSCSPACDGKDCGAADGCGGSCTRQQGCGPNQTCVNGDCVGSGCGPGLGQCAASDPVACHTCCEGGAGDDGCPGNQICGSGAVRCECEKPGFAVVPGCGPNCVCGPQCTFACAPDETCCPETGCANTRGCGPATNGCLGHRNCGTCGNHCSENQNCCSGTCVSLNTPENCGFCGAQCPANTQCCGLANCQPTCP